MKKRRSILSIGLGLVMLFFFLISPAAAATDAEVAAAIAGGQKYLFDNFDATAGKWTISSYGDLAATGFAVSALIDTGKYSDAAYAAIIDKGINLIKTFVVKGTADDVGVGNDGIYSALYLSTYETGLALVALSRYGQIKGLQADVAYNAIIQNAYNFLKYGQNDDVDGSGQPLSPDAYGGWGYSPNEGSWSDLSNTQFAVMGLYYASEYLGLPTQGEPWANKLSSHLNNRQLPSGGFEYQPGWGATPQMTGAGLWCLAMIGEGGLTAGSRAQKAVDWFKANYTWEGQYPGFTDFYFVYAMAKALTITVGPAAKVGAATESADGWVQDLKNTIVSSASPALPATLPDPTYSTSWTYDGETLLGTPWALLAIAFADVKTEGPAKILAEIAPDPIDEDHPITPIPGPVTLQTTGGVTISNAARRNIGIAKKATSTTLPVGAFDFTLNNVTAGGTTVLSVIVPEGAFDKANPDSFLDADGNVKTNLRWFKIQDGAWNGQGSIHIEADIPTKTIKVTLTDGGPGDDDGVANGKIVDPGAPGLGDEGAAFVPGGSAATSAETKNSFPQASCFIATAAFGSSMAPDVVLLRQFRDNWLRTNVPGRAFVSFYYRVSPPMAAYIAGHEGLRTATRVALTPLVFGIKHPLAAMVIIFLMVLAPVVYRRRKA